MKLQDIVNEYIEEYIGHTRCRPNYELKWFRGQPTLRTAIRFAGLALNSKGRKFDHQWRLSKASLRKACSDLLRNENKIKQCKTFHELHSLLDNLLQETDGIGELYVYDTAFRIGAKLGILPTRVYLHRGTRDGERVLGYHSTMDNRVKTDGRLTWIETSDLPKELQRLKPYEIEDFLCIMKKELGKARLGSAM